MKKCELKYLAILVLLLLSGCFQWKRSNVQPESIELTTETAEVRGVEAEDVNLDSVIYQSDMCDYACYFRKDRYEKEQLVNTAKVLAANGRFVAKYSDPVFSMISNISIEERSRYRDYMIDSVSRLQFLDFEPWITFRRKVLNYNNLQFVREIVLAQGIENPQTFYEYEGMEADSLMRKCVDILVKRGSGFVESTRNHMMYIYESGAKKEDPEAQKRREREIEYAKSRLYERLAAEDSIKNAEKELLVTISNRINSQIHQKNDILAKGNLISYEKEFHKLFDFVREFNINEP